MSADRRNGTAQACAHLAEGSGERESIKAPACMFSIRGIIQNRLQDKGFYYPGDDSVVDLLGDAYRARVETEELDRLP